MKNVESIIKIQSKQFELESQIMLYYTVICKYTK